MKLLRKFSLIAMSTAIMISGCTAFEGQNEVEMLNQANSVGSPFTRQLTEEYRAFSNYELKDMYDYADALHFARKGLAAAEGVNVMPEPISDWDLMQNHMIELSEARGRLINAFDLGAREIVPVRIAMAQARFDCWIEQQEENWQNPDIIGCKSDFFALMNEIEPMLPQPMPELPPVAEPTPPEVMDIREAMYLVFFDFDKSNVGDGGASVLEAVVTEISSRPISRVIITGHTDTSGSKQYNERLANKRSQSVKDMLAARGIDPSMVVTQARGENELLVQTADSTREPANRRATITFE
jgi:OOP family OmpA-OmpF porin